jgi:hypothetical protein
MVGLNERNIFPGVHYQDNSRYRMYADQPPCARARRASERVISLPMHLRLERNRRAAHLRGLARHRAVSRMAQAIRFNPPRARPCPGPSARGADLPLTLGLAQP